MAQNGAGIANLLPFQASKIAWRWSQHGTWGAKQQQKSRGDGGETVPNRFKKFQKTEISGINRPKVLKSELFGSK